jgi:hypothetical protein
MSWFQRRDSSNDRDKARERPTGDGVDPGTAARRRARLEQRINNLEHDIERAASANRPDNRWHRRIAELGAAIEQANADADRAAAVEQPEAPLELPATPVEDIEVTTAIPATVTFRIGGEHFRYSEEIDWTERGEQRDLPGLRRFEGDPARLIPDDAPDDRRAALEEHLRHAVGALAIQLRDAGEGASASLTLRDLATHCPVCGNWRDQRGRCIACQRREWQAAEIRAEVGRLLDERNQMLDEMAKQREALPILQRQLHDARAELEKYTTP